MEAAQHSTHPTPHMSHYNYEMPVDPALMDGMHQPANLEDLPPSPFLHAGRGLPVPAMSALDPLGTGQHAPVARMGDDTHMSGTDEQGVSAGDRLRRRMVNAGFEGHD